MSRWDEKADQDILPAPGDVPQLVGAATGLAIALHCTLAILHQAGMHEKIEEAKRVALKDAANAAFQNADASSVARATEASRVAIERAFEKAHAAVERGREQQS